MVGASEEIIVLDVKRVSKDKQYFDRVRYVENNKIKHKEYVWKKDRRNKKAYYMKIISSESNNRNIKHQKYVVENRKQDISKTIPKKFKTKGYYQSFIKLFIVVQYKTETPFFFPKKGSSSIYNDSTNSSEKQMIKKVLTNSDNYQELMFWFNKQKRDKGIKIYHGWTYKRIFSPTGSFNGDTRYLDFIERRFDGYRMITINYFKRYRSGTASPMVDFRRYDG